MTSPAEYGGPAWFTLHSFAGNALEPQKRQAFVQWMKLWPDVFPCEICENHLRIAMKKYPIEKFMGSAEDLLRYTYILHDGANNHWNAANPNKPRKVSPPWEEVKYKFLALPEEEEEVPALRRHVPTRPLPTRIGPAPRPISVRPAPTRVVAPASVAPAPAASVTNRTTTIPGPMFQQFKAHFHQTNRW